MPLYGTWYVWIFLFAQVMVVFKGKLLFFWPRKSREKRQTGWERACSAPLPLPVQSISFVWLWWIMDEAIDRVAQLCSTDPLRTHIHTQYKSDRKLKGDVVIFALCNNQNCCFLSNMSVGILGINFCTFCIPSVRLSLELPLDQWSNIFLVLFKQIMQLV